MRKSTLWTIIILFALMSATIVIKLQKIQTLDLTNKPTPRPDASFNPQYNKKIFIGDIPISVEIVDTPEKMALGLSGRNDLQHNEGMLFVYQNPQFVTFWMPNMNFPIDIIFLRNYEIVQIEDKVPNPPKNTPLDQLPRYPSKQMIDMVLEVPAGWVERENIVIGTKLKFEQ